MDELEARWGLKKHPHRLKTALIAAAIAAVTGAGTGAYLLWPSAAPSTPSTLASSAPGKSNAPVPAPVAFDKAAVLAAFKAQEGVRATFPVTLGTTTYTFTMSLTDDGAHGWGKLTAADKGEATLRIEAKGTYLKGDTPFWKALGLPATHAERWCDVKEIAALTSLRPTVSQVERIINSPGKVDNTSYLANDGSKVVIDAHGSITSLTVGKVHMELTYLSRAQVLTDIPKVSADRVVFTADGNGKLSVLTGTQASDYRKGHS